MVAWLFLPRHTLWNNSRGNLKSHMMSMLCRCYTSHSHVLRYLLQVIFYNSYKTWSQFVPPLKSQINWQAKSSLVPIYSQSFIVIATGKRKMGKKRNPLSPRQFNLMALIPHSPTTSLPLRPKLNKLTLPTPDITPRRQQRESLPAATACIS